MATNRLLPHAIVFGTPKSGTTTLCGALMRHPDIYMYPKKETHFFNDLFTKRDMSWYKGLFTDAPDGALLMEGTPDYSMSHCVDRTLERIATHIPDVKLILMVRNPVDRIESHYIQMLSNTRTEISIDQALEKWPEIVETSDYGAIVETLRQYFSEDQLLVLFLEDYKSDKSTVHAQTLEFLEVDASRIPLETVNTQKALHKREDQGVDCALLARLRRWKHYDRINMLMPSWIIALGKRTLRSPLKVPTKLPPATRARLEAEFNPKWAQFQEEFR
ncbi:sulfotransferase family protein [Celeribacter halophilus]|uniref:sulfotransferase family protein n=1 Tax=Celeribacter halophilus TaxID=576117 RepID=UPI001C0800B1|nr:sulfotransferase [Celeribacter halophilus]MBU2888762.1 sulfotransferase [Celeribacter halophilus]MDO6508883.1 sulfotransferase [Celeribacter halophilus]